MNEKEKSSWGWCWLGILFLSLLLFLGLFAKKSFAKTEMDFSYSADKSTYVSFMKTAHYSEWWDKSISWSGTPQKNELELWSDVWLYEPLGISIEMKHRQDFAIDVFRTVLTLDMTKAVAKWNTMEIGLGALWNKQNTYFNIYLGNRSKFDFLIFILKNNLQINVPISGDLEFQDELGLGVYLLKYVNLNLTQGIRLWNKEFENYSRVGLKIEF